MRPSKAHFVTTCQQLLALGAVLAALTPAAAVVSLDVVQRTPRDDAATGSPAGQAPLGQGRRLTLSAYATESHHRSRVPTAPVDAELTEYPLTAAAGDARSPRTSRTLSGHAAGTTSVLSRPEPVVGYGGVGVTWAPGQAADDEDLSFLVRTRTGGAWSSWTTLEYDDDHAPDPDSPEGRGARPGTDVLFVGHVDDVQVRADVADGEPPADLTLAVVGPGRAVGSEREAPAIDTGALPSARATAATADLTTVTPRPRIYSRAQWGADESMRDKGSLRYFEVHAGFVHHTVNANGYSRAEVPGLLRSIYAYHTQSRGWSDVGYNFLVDRFGRIWEGRYGGVDRPVVGAHTLGYNDYSFAMSAIGNFDVTQPGSAMVQAYGALFAWKLSLHGVDAGSARQQVGPDVFRAINGHRDAGQTACPGRYLYARLDRIRDLAAGIQEDWSGRDLHSDLAATAHPDLVVRRARDGKVFVLPTGGLTGVRRPVVSAGLAGDADTVVASPDLTGDAVADLLVRRTDGSTSLLPGDGAGRYAAAVRTWDRAFAGRSLVTAVGDLDGDGDADLVAREADGTPVAYLGDGAGGLTRQRLDGDWSTWTSLAATGDLDGDRHVDLLARDVDGATFLLPGTGTASGPAFGTAVPLVGDWSRWETVRGFGDFTRDGRPDLLVRARPGAPAYVLPARPGLTFGEPLGPIRQLRQAGDVVGAAQYAGGALPDPVSVKAGDVHTYPNLDTTELLPPVPAGFAVGSGATLLDVGDWDRDGDGDLVVRTAAGALVARLNDGTGSFGETVRLGGGFGDVRLLAAVGDMTGDGWPDLMGQPAGSSMRLYPGNGRLGLQPSYVAHSAVSATGQVGVGRWDADGAPDTLLRSGAGLTLYPGNGPGGLTTGQRLAFDAAPYDWVVGVSDLRLTGHGDLVVREKATGRLYALTVTATRGITSRRLLGQGMEVYDKAG